MPSTFTRKPCTRIPSRKLPSCFHKQLACRRPAEALLQTFIETCSRKVPFAPRKLSRKCLIRQCKFKGNKTATQMFGSRTSLFCSRHLDRSLLFMSFLKPSMFLGFVSAPARTTGLYRLLNKAPEPFFCLFVCLFVCLFSM